MDAPLKWREGRSQALTEIGDTEIVEDVEAGGTYTVPIDHGDLAEFAIAEAPRIEEIADVAILLCCDGTDGGHFKLCVMIADTFTGEYYGYGGPGPDLTIRWTRRGVLDGAA